MECFLFGFGSIRTNVSWKRLATLVNGSFIFKRGSGLSVTELDDRSSHLRAGTRRVRPQYHSTRKMQRWLWWGELPASMGARITRRLLVSETGLEPTRP